MPIILTKGKDTVIFATKEEHATPCKIDLPEPEPNPGLILPNGDINWNCPCLGGMATGPCGVEFREAFSCFHYSTEEVKGSDCYEAFKSMQQCTSRYPALYASKETALDNIDDESEDHQSSETSMMKKETPKSLDNIGTENKLNSNSNEGEVVKAN